MTLDQDTNTAQTILQEVWGYQSFRGLQHEIIDTVVQGNDAMVIMPTGGGKSLCYQIPALIRSGTAIVVSPLIALMQDQVTALKELGVKAACLNSALTPDEATEVRQMLLAGRLDLLYISPERVLMDRTLEMLDRIELSLLAIDESHCVSAWGHDFRPEYLQLANLTQRYPDLPRIALTATADQRTRQEIIDKLHLAEADHFIAGFDRPNIQYNIQLKDNAKKQLLDFINGAHANDSGIVYCLSRKRVEEFAQYLQDHGHSALPYHAGLDNDTRKDHQHRFVNDEVRIIVATIAFGMGIDKPDVRFVAHMDLPKNVESYYQQTGRAGRDGLPASAWMVYGLRDVTLLRSMIQSSDAPEQRIRVELQKLNALLGICESTMCRRAMLLKYFGDEPEERCGNCDACLKPVKAYDGSRYAQMLLSAVYRTGQLYGATYLIDILTGKSNARIQQNGHDQLTCYSVGQELKAPQWKSIIRQMVARELLWVDLDNHGSIKLTREAVPVLKGEESIQFRMDPVSSKKSSKSRTQKQQLTISLSPDDQDLFDALRELRLEIARDKNIPPYVVFSDRTLLELVNDRPGTLEDMRQVNGVGATKLKRYGSEFLEILINHP